MCRKSCHLLEDVNNDRYAIFTNRVDVLGDQLRDVLKRGKLTKGIFVASERQNIWLGRTKGKLGEFCKKPLKLFAIKKPDATEILKKLEKYGPWTRLSKMSVGGRIHELVTKAKRQLLIGLLETTSGRGFEDIIKNDYAALVGREEKLFLLTVGLATVHRATISETLVSRAMRYLDILDNPRSLVQRMSGIVHLDGSSLVARHPVYVRFLFESIAAPRDIADAIKSLLRAFSVYRAPVIMTLTKKEGLVFKSILNYRFLKDVLRGDRVLILNVYLSFEKVFQDDGMYWLQYGLSLRDFDIQEEAFEKLQTAYSAYPTEHTEHALAQQLLIMAYRSETKASAYEYVAEAKERLERLDSVMDSDDTYPIVTLSEGHTSVVRKFEGDQRGQAIAAQYANILSQRVKYVSSENRLKAAWGRLTTYATTGQWVDHDNWVSEF